MSAFQHPGSMGLLCRFQVQESSPNWLVSSGDVHSCKSLAWSGSSLRRAHKFVAVAICCCSCNLNQNAARQRQRHQSDDGSTHHPVHGQLHAEATSLLAKLNSKLGAIMMNTSSGVRYQVSPAPCTWQPVALAVGLKEKDLAVLGDVGLETCCKNPHRLHLARPHEARVWRTACARWLLTAKRPHGG